MINDYNKKPLSYTEYALEPALAEYVLCGWSFEADDFLEATYMHHVLPDGCISLIYRGGRHSSGGSLMISGPRIHELRVEVRPGDRYWGIKFWPDAGGVILGIDPFDARERTDLLAMRLPVYAQALNDDLEKCREAPDAINVFQRFVSLRRLSSAPLDAVVRQCVESINRCDGSQQISDLAVTLKFSQRQLQRRFRTRVGLTPKEYSRIRRMRVALANAIERHPKGWVAVAAETGYADQAHFSRETAALTGLSPACFEERIERIKHHNVDP